MMRNGMRDTEDYNREENIMSWIAIYNIILYYIIILYYLYVYKERYTRVP